MVWNERAALTGLIFRLEISAVQSQPGLLQVVRPWLMYCVGKVCTEIKIINKNKKYIPVTANTRGELLRNIAPLGERSRRFSHTP